MYQLATSSWDDKEKDAAKKVIDSGMCTMGPITKKFEEEFAKKVGSKYAVFSNSGSSANLLAVASLFYRKEGMKLKPGDEVIVPAVSWATTYYPLYQYGLKLKFVDIDPYSFNIDTFEIKKYITKDTKAIFAVNLLGMPCNFMKLQEICDEYNLILLEDNCESLGAKYNDKQCGTFGLIGTYSLFFSHHLCSVEGGFCVTNDEELYQIMVSLRAHGWIRNLPDKNKIYNKSGNYVEDTFKFVLPGYNLRPNDIFSAIGLEQLNKWDSIINWRIKNAEVLKQIIFYNERLHQYFHMQTTSESLNKYEPSWFGFGFIFNNQKLRNTVINLFNEAKIEFRPIVAGNFTKNPVIKYFDYKICGHLPWSNKIDECGLFIGNNGIDMIEELALLDQTLRKLT